MSFRAAYGLREKPIKACPVCGVSTVGGLVCGNHAAAVRNSRREYHRTYYWRNHAERLHTARIARAKVRLHAKYQRLIEELCTAVDIGRATANW